MRVVTILLISSVLALAGATVASGRTWYILPNGGGDAPTIQAGIDSAAVTDSVVLAAGTYTGVGNREIDFLGKAITVTSESGRDVTIIDCQGLGNGFVFQSGESAYSILSGVTIRNGTGVHGGGICCVGSSPTVSNDLITGNIAQGFGGGIFCSECPWPIITNNIISGNSAGDGGGIACVGQNSSPNISNTTISGNTASAYGDGGGIWCYDFCYAVITNCTISGNAASYGGGMAVGLWASAAVTNTIISFSSQGEAVSCGTDGVGVTCCDVYGNAGGDWVGCIAGKNGANGNFSADPLFCLRWPGDYCIDYSSPCAPGNHPYGYDCGLIGAAGVGCDHSTGIQPTTWGRVKSMFR